MKKRKVRKVNRSKLERKLDEVNHTMVRSEKVMHKENIKGVVKSYEMNANNQLIDVTIA